MLIKFAVIALLLVIIASLGSSLYFLAHDDHDSTRAVKALSWRIGLSIGAFALLMVGALTGLVESNAVPVG